MKKHTWTEADDLMILFIYKFGFENSPLTKSEISEQIGTSVGSVNYRIGNFKAINGIGKITHYAKLSFEVHTKYSSLNQKNLKEMAFGKK